MSFWSNQISMFSGCGYVVTVNRFSDNIADQMEVIAEIRVSLVC